jgi:hypothetical protein
MSDTTNQTALVVVKAPTNWQVFIVALLLLVQFAGALGYALWTKDPSLQFLVPVASTMATAAAAYYLGSSSSSHTKDATIAAQAAKQ